MNSIFLEHQDCNIQSAQTYPLLGRSGIERIDLLYLAMESIDISISESLLIESKRLGIDSFFPNRVEIWKIRSYNPMRKTYLKGSFSKDAFEALTLLLSSLADKYHPLIRQYLSSKEPNSLKEQRWRNFHYRFNSLIRNRLNLGRGIVKKYLQQDYNDVFYKQLVLSLALSTGSGGHQRLKASLFDNLN